MYPEIVVRLADVFIKAITSKEDENYFEINDLDFAYELFHKKFLSKYVNGEIADETIRLTHKEIEELLGQVYINDLFISLKNKGLVDSIEDPDISDDRLFHLTEKGKEIGKILKNIDNENTF